jgi:hypothetical protein
MGRRPQGAKEPDVEISARVRACEVRFESRPLVDVVVHSDTPAQGGAESERRGIPDEVQPGVAYKDVAVRWRASARLKDPPQE